MKERRLQKGEETKRKRAVYTYRIFENFKSRKKQKVATVKTTTTN